jgi:tetratricopeptide (TPR) repeat protein
MGARPDEARGARVDNRVLQTRQGWLEVNAGRHQEALAIWMQLLAEQPDDIRAVLGGAYTLFALGRSDEVARLAEGEGTGATAFAALLAEKREDWPRALACWQALPLDAGDDPLVGPRIAFGIATAELRLGHAAEAVRAAEAELAMRPKNPRMRDLLESARLRTAKPPALAPYEPPPGPELDAAGRRAMLLEFENVGRNCEFGLVQRAFGAEPIGLLRWGATWIDPLLNVLMYRLEGVGEPKQTRVELSEDGREYLTWDLRYRFNGHVPITGTLPERAIMERKQCQRLGFLARMMRETLDSQSRIFVYQAPELALQEMTSIYHALAAYGPNFLLCVREADAEHPPGHVEAGERLVVGYIDRQGVMPDKTWNISHDLWLRFCRAAIAWRAEWRAAHLPAPAEASAPAPAEPVPLAGA